MKTIAAINFKGGVGKTTTTWCLGDVLSVRTDNNILLFDLDAQSSLTQSIFFGDPSIERPTVTIYDMLKEFLDIKKNTFNPEDNFILSIKDSYDFVPAANEIYYLPLEQLDHKKGRYFIDNLLGEIRSSELPEYDYVLFDCPPSFTLLSYSVFTCCDLILIPVNPDFFAAKGIELLLEGIRRQIKPNPLPKIAIFANRVRTYAEQPTRKARGYIHDIKEICNTSREDLDMDVRFLNAWIPDRASLRDAISNRKTPRELHENFGKLWKEIRGVLR